jgi:HK97 family phage portal protein
VKIFGIELTRARARAAAVPVSGSGRGGWYPVIREPFTGAWQQNAEVSGQTALSYAAVFSCTTLIASDIGKVRLRLVERDDEGIWTEVTVPAFSPVLRKPNRYQTINKFLEQWMVSKLVHGNTYALKQRDERRVVTALYVLDPRKVTPLIAPDGSVYYELQRDDLAGIAEDTTAIAVPASEIIHDLMVPLFHPLVGVTPIYACGQVALQGLNIQDSSTSFFANGSAPGGVILVPGSVDQATADRIKENWQSKYSGPNVGRVGLLADGMKYEPMTVNANDAQLIEQLKWTTETICACYHVPAALIDSSHQPPYANSEPLVQQYFAQCLQCLIVALENALDDGLGLLDVPGHVYGTEFDIDDLIWMDTKTKTDAATSAVSGGVLSPNESRKKYFGLGSVEGGDSPYLQQQQFSLSALAERDADDPFSKPVVPTAPPAAADAEADDDERFAKSFLVEFFA